MLLCAPEISRRRISMASPPVSRMAALSTLDEEEAALRQSDGRLAAEV